MATEEYDITLGFIYKEAVGKHKELQVACEQVIDALRPHMRIEINALRDKCILPLRLAIQTGNGELGLQGIQGMRQLLSDTRLTSAFESDSPNDYLHMKLLRAVFEVRSVALLTNSAAQQTNAIQLVLLAQEICERSPQVAIEYCIIDLFLSFALSLFKDPRCSAKLRLQLRCTICHVLAEFATHCTQADDNTNEAEDQVGREQNVTLEVQADSTSRANCFRLGAVRERMLETLNRTVQFCAGELRTAIRAHINALRAFGAYSQHVSTVATRPSLSLALAALRALFESVHASTMRDRFVLASRLGVTVWRELLPTISSLFGDPRLIRDEADTPRANFSLDPLSAGSPTNDVDELARSACELSVQITLCCADSLELRAALQAALHRTLLFERYRPHALRAIRKLVASSDRVWSLLVAIDDRVSGTPNSLPVIAAVGDCPMRVAYASGILQLVLDCVAHTMRTNATLISAQQDTTLPFVGGTMLLGGDTPNVDELHRVSADLMHQLLASLGVLAKESNTAFGRLVCASPPASVAPHEDQPAQTASSKQSAPFEDYTVRRSRSHSASGSSEKPGDTPNKSDVDHVSCVPNDAIDERKNARLFYTELKQAVPHLLALSTREQIDAALQSFASSFCTNHVVSANATRAASPRCNVQFLNADSTYVCAYVTLIYSVHLAVSYAQPTSETQESAPETETASHNTTDERCAQFVADTLAMHTQMYVSEVWLCQLYACVVEEPLLGLTQLDSPLGALLNDVDYTQLAAQASSRRRVVPTVNVQRAVLRKFVSDRFQQLAEIVTSMLTYSQSIRDPATLSAASTLNRSFGMAGIKSSKSCNELSPAAAPGDNVLLALETTECFLQLLSDLDMHNLCEKLLNKLLDLVAGELRAVRGTAHYLKLRSASALICDVVLRRALVLCIPYPPCWIPALRCCTLVSRFDRLSSQTELSATLDGGRAPPPPPPPVSLPVQYTASQTSPHGSEQTTPKHSNAQTEVSLRSLIQAFQPNKDTLSASFVLNAIQTRVVLTRLTQQVDQVFVDTLNTLKLKHTVEFLEQYAEYIYTLCGDREETNDSSFSYSLSATLTRFWNILLSLVQTKSRPLVLFEALRILRTLTASACPLPKLTNQVASCFSSVSANALLKTHLSTLHEFTLSFLTVVEVERHLPHFTVNESLLRLYVDILITSDSFHETMLLSQTHSHPSILISEELLSSIHEMVEAHAAKIRSGWRPLFSVIRHVRTSTGSWTKSAKALMQVVDVLRAFLALESFPIFAESAFDYAQTLLAYLACECSKHTRDKCAHTAVSLLNATAYSYCEQDDSDSDTDSTPEYANTDTHDVITTDSDVTTDSEDDIEGIPIPDPPRRRRKRTKIDLFVKVLEAYTPRIVKQNLSRFSAPRKTSSLDLTADPSSKFETTIDWTSFLEEGGHGEFCVRLLELIEELFETLRALAVDRTAETRDFEADALTCKYVRKLVALFETPPCVDHRLPPDANLPFTAFYDEPEMELQFDSLKQLEATNGTLGVGVLHLLAFLIDSLCTSLLHCDVSQICNVIDSVFRLLEKAGEIDVHKTAQHRYDYEYDAQERKNERAFVLFLFTHSVLPLAQKWLRALVSSDLVSLSQLHNTNIPKNIRSRVRYILVCFQHYCIKLTQFFADTFARAQRSQACDAALASLLCFAAELSVINGNFILSRCSVICLGALLSSPVLRRFTEPNWNAVTNVFERLILACLQPTNTISKYVEAESKLSSRVSSLECRPLRRMHRVEWSNRIQIANILFGSRFSEKLVRHSPSGLDDPSRYNIAFYDYAVLLKQRGTDPAEIQLPTLLHRTACCFGLVHLVRFIMLRNPTFKLPPRVAEVDAHARAMFEVDTSSTSACGETLVEHLPSVLVYDSLSHEILIKLLKVTLYTILDYAAQFEQNENSSASLEIHLLLNKLFNYAGCASVKSESRPLHPSGFGLSRLLKYAAVIHAHVLMELSRHASDEKRREQSLTEFREFLRHVTSFLARSNSTVESSESVSLADCRTLSVKLLDNFRACASPKPKEQTTTDCEEEQLGMRFLSTMSDTLVAILALLEQCSDADLQRFIPSLFPTLVSTVVPFLWSHCAALRGSVTQPLGRGIQNLMDAVVRTLERVSQLDANLSPNEDAAHTVNASELL